MTILLRTNFNWNSDQNFARISDSDRIPMDSYGFLSDSDRNFIVRTDSYTILIRISYSDRNPSGFRNRMWETVKYCIPIGIWVEYGGIPLDSDQILPEFLWIPIRFLWNSGFWSDSSWIPLDSDQIPLEFWIPIRICWRMWGSVKYWRKGPFWTGLW